MTKREGEAGNTTRLISDSIGSDPGAGCASATHASGGHLHADGSASVGTDSLVLSVSGVEPSNTGLLFQGGERVDEGQGSPFGE